MRRRRAESGSPWEEFAGTDPTLYIDPTLGRGVSVQEFIDAGGALVDRELAWAGVLCDHDRALEIGCGIGRNTVHLAQHFEQVDGIDISPTMVRQARALGLPGNLRLHVGNGRDLDGFEGQSFAFVFSHLVFQHVVEDNIIESYMREIARVLRPGGVAVLQFDTRRVSKLAAVVHLLPDVFLPKTRRHGVRRCRRPAFQIRQLGQAAGLLLDGERDPDTAEHWFRWRAPAAAAMDRDR
jgi:SAM-dependent methyltransferase